KSEVRELGRPCRARTLTTGASYSQEAAIDKIGSRALLGAQDRQTWSPVGQWILANGASPCHLRSGAILTERSEYVHLRVLISYPNAVIFGRGAMHHPSRCQGGPPASCRCVCRTSPPVNRWGPLRPHP